MRGRLGRVAGRPGLATGVSGGLVVIYLSLIVLIPLGAVVYRSTDQGWSGFWQQVTAPQAWSALKLTIVASLLVALVNMVMGTLIAWILVRDKLPGQQFFDTLIDLPFALPTIVAGLTLLVLYGPNSPIGVDLAYARAGVVMALLFVTLPFVVRSVQPVVHELDREMEEAAASLGAGGFTIFRRVILPNLVPAILSGVALAFARAVGEFGAVILISGNIPFKTQVASVQIFSNIESDRPTAAAALSVVLLVISFLTLLAIDMVRRWGSKHES
jgi:sulfate transport system permease protein